ncbi:uncharacterized protein LOC133912386 [Phragmites australis]|uniref:uncharacterized protein LOC133912386 n=1 Tax=Phragmites australis TaxID=29695 RepID=UPI002D77473C|nr:uncharacterized protein LOC133912386 [Phragmites australis]
MDAVSCVSVPPPTGLLSRSFTDAAIARALHFSLSDAPEPSVPATDLGARAAATATTNASPEAVPMHGAGAGGHPPMGAAPSPPSARCLRLGPAGGHAGKRRRPRPSKRVPTTYISTDAATFRIMVQRVTGIGEAEPQQDAAGLGLFLPHFGLEAVEQFLPADSAATAAHVAAAYTLAPTAAATVAEQQPLFPTLDSWDVMYGKNEVV